MIPWIRQNLILVISFGVLLSSPVLAQHHAKHSKHHTQEQGSCHSGSCSTEECQGGGCKEEGGCCAEECQGGGCKEEGGCCAEGCQGGGCNEEGGCCAEGCEGGGCGEGGCQGGNGEGKVRSHGTEIGNGSTH